MRTTTTRAQKPLGILDFALSLQREHEGATTPEERKRRGQVFTPPEVCQFMAGLFGKFPRRVRLLDPGAGVGALTAAVCERVCGLRSSRVLEVHLYETDPALKAPMKKVMARCREALEAAGHSLVLKVHDEDFILANAHTGGTLPLFASLSSAAPFDVVIMNPPYFKVRGDSDYARILRDLVHGQPNIYALFMAVGAELLRPGGEMVAITPRSFCNGLYFRGFRRWFFSRMGLAHAHLFESRRDTFREAGILQESLVTLTRRLGEPPERVRLSTSHGRDELQRPATIELPADTVLDDSCGDMVVRLPGSPEDAQVMDVVEAWPSRFGDLGLRVSTGPVVSFRATRFLLEKPNGTGTVPLIQVGNVGRFETRWPRTNGKPQGFVASDESRALLLPSQNYVLLRRFTAKEERRRLTASCFLRREFSTDQVALENHLNYVYHAHRELSEDETFGLAALFNSFLLDRYFRTLSGNTQVNATELRTMPLPDLPAVARIGRKLRRLKELAPTETEAVVLDVLGVNGAVREHLLEVAR